MEARAPNMRLGLEILVNGYVSRILCEQIPLPYKQAFTEFLRGRGPGAAQAERTGKKGPHFVSPTEVAMCWYSETDTLRSWMKNRGIPSRDGLNTQIVHRFEGLGSGKDGIGLFDMTVRQGGKPFTAYYPFDPPEGMGGNAKRLDLVPVYRLDPPCAPGTVRGYVAVVSGTWARGTMLFRGEAEEGFDEKLLEIVTVDLSDLGTGEDHFVAGVRYRGRDLLGQVVREEKTEPYPVCW